MKKRRELDALVNGKLGRRKKGQHHELLRNDTDSSEVEEFSVSDKDVVRKRGSSSRACATCLIVFGFIVLVACVIAISGLVFVYINIESDVRLLRSQLDKVSGQSKSNPGEFQDIHRQQTDLQKAIREIQSGKGGLLHIRQNITVMLKQLTTLSATTHQLSNSLDAAPQLKALPKTVNDLKKDIADVGSKLAGVQQTIEDLQNSKKLLSDKVDSMKKQLSGMVRVVSGAPEKPADEGSPQMMQEIKGLSDAVTKANLSTWQQFTVVLARGQQHEMQIAELRNVTHDFESRLRLVELAGSPRSEYNLSAVIQQAVNSVKEELLNRSESKGESAVTALRVDVAALNASLHNINTKKNSTAGSPLSTPADITSLSNYMNTTDGKVQQLQKGLQTVVVNITAMDIRLKSHEDRLSAVEKSTHDVSTEATHTTENNTHVRQSEGVLKITQTNDQSASDQHTGLTSSTDNIMMSDKKSSVQLDKNKPPLVATGQTANVQDIFVQEGLPGARSGSGTRGGSSITTQQKSTPSLSNQVKTAEDLAAQFHVWDKDGNGLVPYRDLSFYLGAAADDESFRKYDTDGDGEYSLSELNRAFGFNTGSSDDVTQPISLMTSTESIP